MNIPVWMKDIGNVVVNFGAGVLAAFFGSELAEDKGPKQEIKREVAKKLQKELEPDREDVIKELERLGPDGEAILQFFDEINTIHGGVITVQFPGNINRRYTETWIMSRMLTVETKDRKWMFARWNNLVRQGEEGRKAFLARLSGLDSNWYTQYPRLVAQTVQEKIPNINNNLGGIADFLESLPGGGR